MSKHIKPTHEYRNITQKKLETKLYFPDKSIIVRIAQYKNNAKYPKDTAIAISKTLNYNFIIFMMVSI